MGMCLTAYVFMLYRPFACNYLFLSVTVLHQHPGHGHSKHCERNSFPSTTFPGPVHCAHLCIFLSAISGNILLFQYCPVQRATQQEEPKDQLSDFSVWDSSCCKVVQQNAKLNVLTESCTDLQENAAM